jgi:hypothetical protein
MKEFSVRAFLVLGVAVLGVSLLSASGAAQEKSSDSAQASASQGQTVAGELAEESREAAGEDKNEALKTSASVRFLSKITGLDVHKSYWLAVILNFAIIAGPCIVGGAEKSAWTISESDGQHPESDGRGAHVERRRQPAPGGH